MGKLLVVLFFLCGVAADGQGVIVLAVVKQRAAAGKLADDTVDSLFGFIIITFERPNSNSILTIFMRSFFVVFDFIISDGVVFACFGFGGGVCFVIFAEYCIEENTL